MKIDRHIPDWAQFLIFLFIFFVVLPFIGDVFRKIPLTFFFLLLLCPFFAWCLRSSSLDSSLTDTGYSKVRILLTCISIAIAFLFFAHYDYLRDQLGKRYLDSYSVHYENDIDDYGRPCRVPDPSANGFAGNIILYLSQWAILGLCVGIPCLTWKIAGTSIDVALKRKMQFNNSDAGDGL